jgi:hypothetical protein
LEIAEDKPYGKLAPVSGGENARNRINIPLSLLYQHFGAAPYIVWGSPGRMKVFIL